MIGRLKGVLAEKQPPNLLIDVNGVGYDVLAPMTTFYNLPEESASGGGAMVTLYTHFAVSETSQQLYGFANKADRALFRQLIKVSGVGPKMALGIMSGMSSNDLVACVTDNNVSALVKVPGVGKKTAERLMIEMRDKLKDWHQGEGAGETAAGNVSGAGIPDGGITSGSSAIVSEAEAALVALGYKPVEATKLVAAVLKNNDVTRSEELIRLSLRSMMPGKA